MLYIAYWRTRERKVVWGYVKAKSHKEAYEIVTKSLQSGCYVTHVYEAHTDPTPQNLCINFEPDQPYLFG